LAERRLVLRTDGAARGNPGPAGAGFIVEGDDGSVIDSGWAYLGKRTNNQAEYEALICGLEALGPNLPTHLTVYSDSELMVRQLNGQYKVKDPDLKDRFIRVSQLLLKIGSVSVEHVSRSDNEHADELANQAIDEHLS
jgi:ribonuclease HI